MNLLWCLSVFVLGFVASAGQALLLRSLLATFHGNELTLGIGLALWMIGTALGSLAAVKGWFGFRGKRSLGMAFLSGAAAIPAAVALGRVIGTAAGAHRGELAPLGTAALGGAMLFLPVTAVLGAVFTLACRAAVRGAVHAARAVGRTYMLDAAGAAVGGVTFAFVLVALCGPLQTAMFLSAACLGVGVALLGAPRAALCAACAGVLLASSGIPAALDDRLLSISWPGYDVLASKDTAFQSLVVARREDQVSLFSNGSHVASFPQFEGPELLAHLPLLQQSSPRNVLLVGGNVTGVLREILRHKEVRHVDCVELDPWVTRLVGRWLPEAERAPLSDGRVRLHHLDGRLWIQKADSDFYDVVIMQLPDPYTAQINRFYTLQFFAQTVRILKPDGVLAFRASSAENYVTPLQARYLGTLMHTAAAVFTSVRMTPGEEAVILARAGPGVLTLSPDELLERLENRGVTARYFSSSWLPFHLTQQRLETVAGIQAGSADLNTDFRPVSYFYDVLLWSRRQGGVLPAVLETIQWIRTWQVLLAGLLPAAALALVPRRKGSRSAGYCLLTTGAATITVQVVLLVAYQALSGYVYSRVSLFAALFMAGLALGAWAALRASHTNRARLKRLLLCCQLGMAVWCLSVAGTLAAVERGAASPGVLILWLALPTGVIGGLVFPLASAMRSTQQWGVDRLAASSYALDLTGAATGTLLGSVVLIPILGLIPACLFAASLSGGGAMLLAATPSNDGMGG